MPMTLTAGLKTSLNKISKSIITIIVLYSYQTVNWANQAGAIGFNFADILNQAEYANAAYQSEADIQKLSEIREVELTAYGTIADIQIAYFLITNHKTKQQTIAVRGTANVENAMIDVSLKLVLDEHSNLYLHRGFAHSAGQIYAVVKPLLKKDYAINTTGHSLGGAVAVVLAVYLDQDGFQNGQITTFGQPKVTNLKGASSISNLNILRIVTARDLVPLVPLFDPLDIENLDIFWHAGKEIILLDDNEYAVLEGMDAMLRATRFTQEPLNEENLQHHRMQLYVAKLTQRIDSAKQVDYENSFNLFNLFGSN